MYFIKHSTHLQSGGLAREMAVPQDFAQSGQILASRRFSWPATRFARSDLSVGSNRKLREVRGSYGNRGLDNRPSFREA
jgi:hypothetical protein